MHSALPESLNLWLENQAMMGKLPFEYILVLIFSLVILRTRKQVYLLLRFAYSCFLAPIGRSGAQKDRLDTFYTSQANIYDATRGRLLKGREEMLRLAAAHLTSQQRTNTQKLVWVDIGGGTGWNIERMDEYYGIDQFHAIFLIDLCEPLLAVAKKRFAAKGWKNIHCLCQDASTFVLPDVDNGPPIESISLCTMSYSLSMVPTFYAMLDRVERFLHPTEGLVACVDFYVSGRSSDLQTVENGGDIKRYCSLLNRWFWLHWFEWDHVCLHPSRRNYLEFRFGTIKSVNGRNTFGPFASIPYYIWLGCKSRKDLSSRLSVFGADPLTPMLSPTLSAVTSSIEAVPDFSLSPSLVPAIVLSPPPPRSSSIPMPPDSTGSPLSAFYYQKHNYRMPYIHGANQKQFWSWIYGYCWEDPIDDMRRMRISKRDTVLCITSAGDNALHYAIEGMPKRIHCVDMNPCQGHLLELKLAAIHALEYEDFWKLFGDGRHPQFAQLLDEKLAPHLSSHAYAFWKVNARAFDNSFYKQGYSGWALRVLSYIFTLHGKASQLEAFANASTLREQRDLYEKSIRPVILSGSFVKLVLSNPVFLWNSLGVPMNQLSIFLNETSVRQYAIDTLDPIGRTVHIRTSNYHYYLSLSCKFNPENPPLYLTRTSFEQLKSANCCALESLRVHTDSLANAIRNIEQGSLDIAILMDHMDWYSPSKKENIEDLKNFIRTVRRCMPVGGRVFWRSAAIKPWYAEIWATEGFRTERLSTRSIGSQTPIDQVNMYASLWRALRS